MSLLRRDRVQHYYADENANIHRGVHLLSAHATDAYEGARATVCRFLNAADSREIIFVRGATEGISLVAQIYSGTHVGPGDEILISEMEHHSNIVPWQILCAEREGRLRVIPIADAGELRMDAYEELLTARDRSHPTPGRRRQCRVDPSPIGGQISASCFLSQR